VIDDEVGESSGRMLVLVRHAKAGEGAPDRDRGLTGRGISDAAAIGGWLVERGVRPDQVVVSVATRAAQTWDLADAVLMSDAPVVVDERVYENTVETLLDIVHGTHDRVGTLVVVGHNPSIAGLALGLDDGRGRRSVAAELARAYPTSGVACFDVDVGWNDLTEASATLTAFAVPRG
jgi:phosphohistidine phosphatase